jgi:hypothetical protein
LATHPAEQANRRIVLLLFGFTLLFAVSATIGRLCTGVRTATASRYYPLLAPALIGAYCGLA